MSANRRVIVCAASAALSLFVMGSAQAQSEKQPAPASSATKGAEPVERIGDPYPLDTCPITAKKLGTMGDPVTKIYDGREVRFCCPACSPKFEKDLAANLTKIDEKIIKDQAALYPLKTSVVTGKGLPERPFEFAYGNRLIRLGADSEKADFLKDPVKFLASLDKAVVEQQGKDYVLKTCPVSKEKLGGDMGKPVDLVVAGRLIRLCCNDCKKDVEKDPAKFIAMVDEARKVSPAKPDAGHDKKDDHHDHNHQGK
ncbi:MAG: hypothetical protein SGJ09_15755 [Phycisphaerae bacterium]|nr:hypothetical protein [Phycisphaerae bacterium]MDZ4831640.1 hypothetical protein [Phycisphaerae bacterium]